MDPRHVEVNPGSGRAVYQATNMEMPDFHDGFNALTGGPSVPGVVTFRLEWAPSNDKHNYRYEPNRWEGMFVQNTVTCKWSGRTASSEFHTDTLNPTIFAEVGHEKSGVFFS